MSDTQARLGTLENPSPLPQMTVKATGCDPKDAIRENRQVELCRIYGEVTGVKTKEAKNGDAYTYLIGNFMSVRKAQTDAEREQTGAGFIAFQSEKLFLPGGIQEKVESIFATNGGRPVQFGYDIYARPDATVTIGYRYAASAVVETASTDRLQVMTSELKMKRLPWEAPAETKPAEPAPASDVKGGTKKK